MAPGTDSPGWCPHCPRQWLAQVRRQRRAVWMQTLCFQGKVILDASWVLTFGLATKEQPLAHAQIRSLCSWAKPSTAGTLFCEELRSYYKTKIWKGNISVSQLSLQPRVVHGPLSQWQDLCLPIFLHSWAASSTTHFSNLGFKRFTDAESKHYAENNAPTVCHIDPSGRWFSETWVKWDTTMPAVDWIAN